MTTSAKDIEDLRSPKLLGWFNRYVKYYLAKHFHAIRLANYNPGKIPDKPIICYTNHPSWWDPLLFIFLDNKLFPERISFGPMDDNALKNYSFMRRLGIFGVEQDSYQGSKEFLSISQHLLNNNKTLLWIAGQGQFADCRLRPLALKSGLSHLVKANPEITLLPIAFELGYWYERFPEILIRIGEPLAASNLAQKSTLEVTRCLEQNLTDCMNALADQSIARTHQDFKSLLGGNAGVGGVYGTFKRLKSILLGQEYQPEHNELDHD